MPRTTLDTIDELLEGAEDGITNSETVYKLRSARQLVQVLQQRHDDLDDALDDAIPDDEIVANLQELGYLE